MRPAHARPGLSRRRWLACACAQGAAGGLGLAWAVPAQAAVADDWQPPDRLTRPDIATDEGGLWALMDREETRLRRGGFVLRDAGLRQYLADIVCKLDAQHCADTRVYAVRTPWFNATMAPNGMMQVWTGLLLRVDNEAQLAAVLGHEIGHYLQRHSVAMMRDMRGRAAFANLMALAGVVGLIGQLATMAGAYSFSRENETEADRIGLLLMRRAGYDTREAAVVWANLRAELTAGAGGDPAKRSVLFASHPPTDERQALLAELSANDSGFLGADDYAARIEPFMADLLDDELKRAQYDETLALLQRLAARRPQRADLRYARGEAYRLRAAEGDLARARTEYEAALTLDKPPPRTHRALGLLYRQAGQADAARQAFETYLQLAPHAPDAAMIQSYLSPSP